MKNTTSEIKIYQMKSKVDQTSQKISELSEIYNIAIEHIKEQNNRNKIETIQNKTQEKIFKNAQSCGTISSRLMYMQQESQKRERVNWKKKLREIIAEYFPHFMKTINPVSRISTNPMQKKQEENHSKTNHNQTAENHQ